ncbi:MAG: hypothetical protein ACLUBZ_09355 [Ruthenibacterium lactatiformans]|uniref:hypothetical protein n=1 Tax=Ruthenibacterium lactatiformans TaxID=1550024 RepID=UPI003996224D
MLKKIERQEILKREYGPYHAKIYFAEKNVPDADEKLLDAIMQSYRQRIGRESQEVRQTIKATI